ncbi:hypothetical protein MMC25_000171 [Agyrium rufum]|nr:hypothetical protein [Agyrium rufum]
MVLSSAEQKLLRQVKFPPEFMQKVDMQKVNVEVMKKWIAGKISDILGSEDDVVIQLCFNLLEGARYPNIKELQIQLTGFLDKDTARFCKDLWMLCLSAQSNPQGVPKELLEAKKLELIQEKHRSMQTRLRNKHRKSGKKNSNGNAIPPAYDNVNGAKGEEAEEVVAGDRRISIDAPTPEIRGPHLRDGGLLSNATKKATFVYSASICYYFTFTLHNASSKVRQRQVTTKKTLLFKSLAKSTSSNIKRKRRTSTRSQRSNSVTWGKFTLTSG